MAVPSCCTLGVMAMLKLNHVGRLDLSLYNEATAFALAAQQFAQSPKECARVVARADQWERAIKQGRFLPIGLRQDDSFVIRIVTGELRPQEVEEWVGQVRGTLELPDGALVIAAGLGFLEDPEALEDTESVQTVEVPPGKYSVTVYSYLSGVNGELDCPGVEDEQEAGAWFRQTRPGQAMPNWLRWWLEEEDSEPSQDECVDFLVHLEPLRKGAEPPLRLEHRVLWAVETRRPERFPLGLAVEDLIRSIPPVVHEVRPPEKVDVLSRVADVTPEPFEGKPIPHPVGDLWQVYRIPFYCNDSVNGEIILDLPNEAAGEAFQETETVAVEREGTRLRVGFGATGARWALMRWLKELRAPLSTLPDGTRLEMVFADEESSEEGRQRWVGSVRAGQWEIEATWPPVERGIAAEAIALCRAVDEQVGLEAQDDDEAEVILDELKDDIVFSDSKVRREGLRLIPDDPELLQDQLAIHLFQNRYEAWPFLPVVDDEELGFGSLGLGPRA